MTPIFDELKKLAEPLLGRDIATEEIRWLYAVLLNAIDELKANESSWEVPRRTPSKLAQSPVDQDSTKS